MTEAAEKELIKMNTSTPQAVNSSQYINNLPCQPYDMAYCMRAPAYRITAIEDGEIDDVGQKIQGELGFDATRYKPSNPTKFTLQNQKQCSLNQGRHELDECMGRGHVINRMPSKATYPSNKVVPAAAAATETAREQQKSHNKPEIKFGTVDVRYYERILGDNPACSSGPSLSIGWFYTTNTKHQNIPVNEYEYYRIPIRMESCQLVLPRTKRESMLQEMGYSRQEIAEAVRMNNKIKNQRNQTVNNLSVSKMEEVVEKARQRMKKLICWKKTENLE